MPSISTLLREKETLMEKYPQRFYGDVAKQQERMYRQIDDLLRQLQFDENGNLLTNEFNVGVSDRIIQRLNVLFYNEDYLDAVNTYMSGFDKSVELNDGWLKSLGVENVTDITTNAKVAMTTMKRNSTNLLVGQSAINSSFFAPIKQTLDDAVTNRMGMRELDKAIRTTIVGNDQVDGRLLSYSKQIANDAIATGDRNYSALSAQDAGVEFYKYTGGLISDSRSFCVSRNDKFFHHKEIAEWGTKPQSWSGRFRNTNDANIFTWLGGYNCKHSIIPVSEISVPKDVLERAMAKGYYKPSEAIQKRLGISSSDVPKEDDGLVHNTQKTYDDALGRKMDVKQWDKRKQTQDDFYGGEAHWRGRESVNVDSGIDSRSFQTFTATDKRHGIITGDYYQSVRVLDVDEYEKMGTLGYQNFYGVTVFKKKGVPVMPYTVPRKRLENFYQGKIMGKAFVPNSVDDIIRNKRSIAEWMPMRPSVTYVHERAHYLQDDDSGFITRLMKDQGLKLKDAPSKYGRTNADEFWAESFTLYDASPELMLQHRPKLYKFVQEILKSSTATL